MHGLRHSNISLLVENGATMKEAQEWAGHSNFNTTADVYSHVEANNKIKMMQTLKNALS
ncbi:MAG: tyrosine-type recombinase/integrase [Acutalibacteraceae bacterium]